MAKRLDFEKVNVRNIAGGNLYKVNLAVNKQQSEVMMQTNQSASQNELNMLKNSTLKNGNRLSQLSGVHNMSQTAFDSNKNDHWNINDPWIDRSQQNSPNLTGYGKSLDHQSAFNKLASPIRSPYKDYDEPCMRQKVTLPRVTANSKYKD